MKLFLVSLFAASQMICNSGLSEFGQIICTNNGCENFITNNGLSINFKKCNFRHFNRRSAIGVYCEIENKTDGKLFFDRRSFSIGSNKKEYVLYPQMIYKNSRVENLPDTFSLEPHGGLSYYFDFRTKHKMSRKKYLDLFGADTVRFEYTGYNHKATVFRMIALLKIDPELRYNEIKKVVTQ